MSVPPPPHTHTPPVRPLAVPGPGRGPRSPPASPAVPLHRHHGAQGLHDASRRAGREVGQGGLQRREEEAGAAQVLLHLLGADEDGRRRAHGEHRADETRPRYPTPPRTAAKYPPGRPRPPARPRSPGGTAPRPAPVPSGARRTPPSEPLRAAARLEAGTAASSQAPPVGAAATPPSGAAVGKGGCERRGSAVGGLRLAIAPRGGTGPPGDREAAALCACAQPPRKPGRCRSILKA